MICRGCSPLMLLCCSLLTVGVVSTASLSAAPQDPQREAPAGRTTTESELKIRFVGQGKGPAQQKFVLHGLGEDALRTLAARANQDPNVWGETMVVSVASRGPKKPRPMLGEYSVEDATLAFVPRFPLRRGTTYRVEVFTEAGQTTPAVARDFELAARGTYAPTSLLAVYPSAHVLPENQLKFYLQFSSPMSRGEAYRRIKLLDQRGTAVEFPFLELGEELWDPSGMRFTLFFDPGRIKRGLQPRELFGPALEEGGTYTLVIDQQWKDARGHPLKTSHHKKFRVVAPDDTQPVPSKWQMITPAVDSRQPLVVSFGEALDHAMLQRVLTVTQADQAVAGRVAVSKQESQWSFQPDDAWAAGTYSLNIDAALEDLAGNSVGRPFEIDVFEKIDRAPAQGTVRLPFEILP